MVRCCVPGCSSKELQDGLSYHSFPVIGLAFWNKFCGLDPGEPQKSSRKICSLHFKKTDFLKPGKGQTPRVGALPFYRPVQNRVPVQFSKPAPKLITPKRVVIPPVPGTSNTGQERNKIIIQDTIVKDKVPKKSVTREQSPETEGQDISGFCRLCLNNTNGDKKALPLFNDRKDKRSPVSKYLLNFFQIELEENKKWPSFACGSCVDFLEKIKLFKKQILSTHCRIYDTLGREDEDQEEVESTPPPKRQCMDTDWELEIEAKTIPTGPPIDHTSMILPHLRTKEGMTQDCQMEDSLIPSKVTIAPLRAPPKLVIPRLSEIKPGESLLILKYANKTITEEPQVSSEEIVDHDPIPEDTETTPEDPPIADPPELDPQDSDASFAFSDWDDGDNLPEEAFSEDESKMTKEDFDNKYGLRTRVLTPRDREKDAKHEEWLREMGLITCAVCQEDHATLDELLTHMKKSHGMDRPYVLCCATKHFHKGGALEHAEYHCNKEAFQCKTCGKQCTTKLNFSRHMANHSEHKFTCMTCGKSFAQKRILQSHERFHLPMDQRPFKCDFCEQRFVSLAAVRRHVERVHEVDMQRCICETCGKGFSSKSTLHEHRKANHGAPKECKICGLSFKCVYSHMRSVHRSLKEPTLRDREMIECVTCGVEVQRSLMRKHNLSHGPNPKLYCKICDKQWKSNGQFYLHMEKHKGRKFPCKFCDRVFDNYSSCYSHLKSKHAEERREEEEEKEAERMKEDIIQYKM